MQFFGHGGAAVVRFAQGVPKFFQLCRCFGFAQLCFSAQGIAAHFAIVVHPKAWVFLGNEGPITLAAQLQQPIVAQAVLCIGACIRGQKFLNFSGAGLVQANAQLPIRRPWL